MDEYIEYVFPIYVLCSTTYYMYVEGGIKNFWGFKATLFEELEM